MKRTLINATCFGIGALLAVAGMQAAPAPAKDAPAKNTGAEKKTKNPTPRFVMDPSPLQRQGMQPASFAPIIKKAAPSVVSVFSSRTVQDDLRNPLLNDPFLRRFFGGEPDEEDQPQQQPRRGQRRPRSHQEMGLGSGVIVTEDGYIITNNHVVENADEVKVETSSGTRYTARVIGSDADTDTAVIKIEAEKLPAMIIGN